MSSWRHVLIPLTILQCLNAGCALTGTPYVTSASGTSADPCPFAELAFIEGQPRGLRLSLKLAAPSTRCSEPVPERILLLKQAHSHVGESGAFEVLTAFDRETHAETLFAHDEVVFLDQELKNGQRYTYLLGTQEQPHRETSSIVITWIEAPPAPEAFAAEVIGNHAYLSWSRPKGSSYDSAMIFRRDLTKQEPYKRLSGIIRGGQTEFVDDDLINGAVYGYLISSVDFSGEISIIGPPSEELFVETSPL